MIAKSISKTLLLQICIIINCKVLIAQKVIYTTNPDAAGVSSEKLKKVDTNLKKWVDKGWINGATAIAIKNGKIVYHNAVGFNDFNTKALVKKDDIYRIASQTKAITSVAIMMLLEDGELLLDDPVWKYIPSFKNQTVLDKYNEKDSSYTTVPAKREITIRDLLTHTSGIGYANIGSKEANAIYAKNKITAGIGEYNQTLLEAMSRLGRLPLMHQPATRWTYGLNTDVLGCIVEVVSGQSLETFFKSRIFEPLGMVDTHFNLPPTKANRLTNIFKEDSTGRLIDQRNGFLGPNVGTNYPLVPHTYFSGGAGLSSTVYDYAIFLQMLLNGGKYNGKQLLNRNTVRLMTTNQIGDVNFGLDKFGLGFSIVTDKSAGRNMAQEGAFSWGGAFSTHYWVDPKEKLIICFYRQLTNTTHTDLPDKFRNLIYQSIID